MTHTQITHIHTYIHTRTGMRSSCNTMCHHLITHHRSIGLPYSQRLLHTPLHIRLDLLYRHVQIKQNTSMRSLQIATLSAWRFWAFINFLALRTRSMHSSIGSSSHGDRTVRSPCYIYVHTQSTSSSSVHDRTSLSHATNSCSVTHKYSHTHTHTHALHWSHTQTGTSATDLANTSYPSSHTTHPCLI